MYIRPRLFLLFVCLVPIMAHAAEPVQRPVNYVAVITFILFISVTLYITKWAAARTASRKDFYAAGNQITGMQNGFAIAGDYMSAASFLGLVGLTFIAGYDAIYFIISLVAGWAVILFLIAERLRNLGSYTYADVVSIRLQSGPIRKLAACGTLAVAIPYLIAQMVAAGTLVESLFGLSYVKGVASIGLLMTIYVTFGGMIATTWVQIVKAILLLSGGMILMTVVLADFSFDIGALATAAVEKHPQGIKIMQPTGLYTDIFSVLSLTLALTFGTAGLPHVLMRFFTVPDAVQARRSAGIALFLIGLFQCMVFVIGLGAIVMLVDNPAFSSGGIDLIGGNNMAAIHLSEITGGDVFLGFISAVAFATILAVVSGVTLSAAATVSHDLFASVIRGGKCSSNEELLVSRVTTIILGIVGFTLAILFEGQNVGVLATLPLVIAASSNFPVLLLSMYWKRFTTRGAVVGGYTGLILSVILIILGPNVWVNALGFEEPIFPYPYPTIFTMPACLICAWYFSITDKGKQVAEEQEKFELQQIKSQFGVS